MQPSQGSRIAQKMKGFSLIELLIVIVIIGILTAIAYPAYSRYVLKSHRTEAMMVLSQDQAILERCYAQNFAYNQGCPTLPVFPQTSPQGYYSIVLSNLGASSYTLTANAIGTQVNDTDCASMTVDQANVRTALDSANAAQTTCWNPT